MLIRTLLKRRTYYDSITLMRLAQVVKALPEVDDVGAVMATAANCELLRNSALLADDWLAQQIPPPEASDLLITVRAADEAHVDAALRAAEQYLITRPASSTTTDASTQTPVRSLELAIERNRSANLAFIAVAGEHAWLEAEQALRQGLHVFLFSDNVPLEQERRLKALALERDLLLMGPDCGTAVINGVGLGFSNVVPAGSIGIVGASGTGMQQVMSLIAAADMGISQAIGTGGRDLSEAIGGAMMRRGLSLLANDEQTAVIVLISKPPVEAVARAILAEARIDKPVVVIFLGADTQQFMPVAENIVFAHTLTEGAMLAVKLAGGDANCVPQEEKLLSDELEKLARLRARLAPSQRFVRALYSGGTLCDEAMLLLGSHLGDTIASNIPLKSGRKLVEGESYHGHIALDLGSDEFTRGRPHPMIDASTRLHYLAQAAQDPETAVLLLDIVLGFCAHANPAAVYAPAILAARSQARARGYEFPIVITLCGTEDDPQRLSMQRATLEAAGALVYESNAVAARVAAYLAGAR